MVEFVLVCSFEVRFFRGDSKETWLLGSDSLGANHRRSLQDAGICWVSFDQDRPEACCYGLSFFSFRGGVVTLVRGGGRTVNCVFYLFLRERTRPGGEDGPRGMPEKEHYFFVEL